MSKATAAMEIRRSRALFPGWDVEQVDLVRRTLAPELNVDELALFIAVADRSGLDVFSRQVYTFKSKGRVCIGIGIDGLRAKADETGCYAPGPEPTFTYGPDGKLESSTAHVLKYSHGSWITVSATCYWDEWAQNTPNWREKKRHMLSKCAEALALRRAFPRQIGQLGTEREVVAMAAEHPADDAGQVIETTAEPVPPPTPKPPTEPQARKRRSGSPKNREAAWAFAKSLGLSPDDAAHVVDCAIGVGEVKSNPDDWTAEDLQILKPRFKSFADDQAGADPSRDEPEAPETPEESATDVQHNVTPYSQAMAFAAQYEATSEQIEQAISTAVLKSVAPEDWAELDRDTFLEKLEFILGIQADAGEPAEPGKAP